MAKFIWAVICQQIITDRETNAVSYINALEAIAVRGFPSVLPQLVVGSLWHKTTENDRVEMRVRVYGPDGDLLHTEPGPVAKFGKQFRRYRVHIAVRGAPAPKAGNFEYSIEQKQGSGWKEVARFPLEVDDVSAVSARIPA